MILNQYSIWRYLLIAIVIVVGCIYAAPNLYGTDPVVQVSGDGFLIQETELSNVLSILEKNDIEIKSGGFTDDRLLVRFNEAEEQLKGAEALKSELGDGYLVTLNLLADTPKWLEGLNALPMYLGLDLRGGIHFLLQVDMETAVRQRVSSDADSIRSLMIENNLRSKTSFSAESSSITVRFNEVEARDAALSILQDEYAELTFVDTQESNSPVIIAKMREQALRDERRTTLTQNITALRNRVNELGVSEPVIQQDGDERIIVQLPGVQDSARAKTILGSTATLEYHLVHGTQADAEEAARTGRVPAGTKLYMNKGVPVLFNKSVIVGGDNITGATPGYDQNNLPAAFVTLDGKGASRMSTISGENINRNMGVLYIETKPGTDKQIEKVISVARIASQLGRRFMTTGLSQKEAQDLSLLLRAGALKAPMKFIEERAIGPSLGKDNIKQGFNSVMIGLALVLVFMLLYYRVFGLIADIALVANLVLLVAILSMLQATLTMPGIAGIVLTVGMAVDANVLIFERIREELRNGNSVQASIHAGYEKAFSTIADANLTTFIVAIILLMVGTGSIKGFAVTLSIGIATSMFTAIIGTRAIVNLIYGGRDVKKLSI